jgi:hypothetical protein
MKTSPQFRRAVEAELRRMREQQPDRAFRSALRSLPDVLRELDNLEHTLKQMAHYVKVVGSQRPDQLGESTRVAKILESEAGNLRGIGDTLGRLT